VSDPRRWREDEGGLSPDELRLLRAGLRPDVPRGAKRAVWVALAAQLSSAVAAASASSGSALTFVSLAKTAGLGLLLGATSVGAVAVVQRVTAHEAAPAHTSAVASPTAPATPSALSLPARDPTPEPPVVLPADAPPALPRTPNLGHGAEALAVPAPPAGPSVAAFPAEGATREPDAESLRVAQARKLLRTGRAREALGALEAVRDDFPNGALAQEREALVIEALRATGRAPEARSRAAEFLARYPQSPHAAAARRALE
jgi:hypothetical protein